MTLQAEHGNAHDALIQASREVERKLQLATEDIEMSKKLAAQFQDKIATTMHDLDTTTSDLKMERRTSNELHSTIQSLSKKLEDCDSKRRVFEVELAQIKKNMEVTDKEASTHKNMLEESRSNLMTASTEIMRLSKANAATIAESLDFKTKLMDVKMQLVDKKKILQKKDEHIVSLESDIELKYAELEMNEKTISDVRKIYKCA